MEDPSVRRFVKDYVHDVINNSIQKALIHVTAGGSQPHDNDVAMTQTMTSDRIQGPCDVMTHVDVIDSFAGVLARDCIQGGLDRVLHRSLTGKRILCVGSVCLELNTVCDKYPDEDTKTLVDEHYWSLGGNAANTATVLAYLGARTEFMGTLVKSKTLDFLLNEFKESGVSFENCAYLNGEKHKSATSILLISKASKTCTTLSDYHGITELSFKQFYTLNLQHYRWIHFEGRVNNRDIPLMVDKLERYNSEQDKDKRISVSMEINHPHALCPGLTELFPKVDVIFISKEYALDSGCVNKEDAVQRLFPQCRRGASLFCTWGEQGAAAISTQGAFSSPAFQPESVADTKGAGATFNAAVLFALTSGAAVEEALVFASKIAGAKCEYRGFQCVRQIRQHFT